MSWAGQCKHAPLPVSLAGLSRSASFGPDDLPDANGFTEEDLMDTAHLLLPYLLASQAQKHVTHNEALRLLDAMVQLAVLDQARTAPPGSPADGDRHIVAWGAT